MDWMTGAFWIALLEIVWVNVLLSGDNAVVIALAARSLPAHQQKMAIMSGSGAAIALRIVLTLFAVQLLQLPYLKLIGALLLLWIGVQLLAGDEGEGDVTATGSQWHAVRTILLADLVMSLDNVLAVAAAANSAPEAMRLPLLVVGLGLSIPLIIFGSSVLLKLMQRFPLIITFGAALLGFVAGQMALTDPAISDRVELLLPGLALPFALVCAAGVVIIGRTLARRRVHPA